MVVSSGTSSLTTTVMMCHNLGGPTAALGQQDLVLLPPWIPKDTTAVVSIGISGGLATLLQQPPQS